MGERSVPGVYDVTMLGFNYRMNEIEAAIGLEQLKRIPSFLQKRRQNYEVLSRALQEVEEVEQLESSNGEYQSSYYCLSVLLNQRLTLHRFEIVDQLKQLGVGTSVYYPHPVPHLSYYKTKYGYTDGSYPVAARISNSSIALPVGPHLDEEDMAYIVDSLKQATRSIKK